ncbi:unnamed protein product, partial [Amoebophrya sp. A25]
QRWSCFAVFRYCCINSRAQHREQHRRDRPFREHPETHWRCAFSWCGRPSVPLFRVRSI